MKTLAIILVILVCILITVLIIIVTKLHEKVKSMALDLHRLYGINIKLADIQSGKTPNEIKLGDLTLKNNFKLGFSIYSHEGKRVCWFNKNSEYNIVQWLMDKNNIKEIK